ncbi:MAG: transposase family protein, partial [Tannerella sp.]|nr:transposase family protein [Tannerella sp.]
MTGYTIDEFNALATFFKEAHDEYLSEYHLNGKRRRGYRRYVMYSNAPLGSIEERLAFILSYLKLNSIQEAQADLFDIEQKQCYEFVHGLGVILQRALEYSGNIPAGNNTELQEVLSVLHGAEERILLHDGTEREIPRPQDEEVQKEKYSGKKKRHTVKNAVIIGCSCMILFVSQTLQGSVHDKKIA